MLLENVAFHLGAGTGEDFVLEVFFFLMKYCISFLVGQSLEKNMLLLCTQSLSMREQYHCLLMVFAHLSVCEGWS